MPHDWLKKLAPHFHPIRSKTKTNRDSLARVFPRFASATCNCYEFWLAHCNVYGFSDWLEWLLWFWFYDAQLKTALFPRLGLPFTLIRHENGAFQKRSSNRRNLKTSAFRFCVEGKDFENAVFRKRWHHDNHVISLTESSSNTNPEWSVLVAFLNPSGIWWKWPNLQERYSRITRLDGSVGRALHLYLRGHGFESRSSLNFFFSSGFNFAAA